MLIHVDATPQNLHDASHVTWHGSVRRSVISSPTELVTRQVSLLHSEVLGGSGHLHWQVWRFRVQVLAAGAAEFVGVGMGLDGGLSTAH